MEFVDARRLTGPNAVFNGIGSVLDVACTSDEADQLVPIWADNVGRMLEALEWPSAEFAFRKLEGGISLAFSAPIDQLYAASEINEWAWAACAFEFGAAAEEPDFDEALDTLRQSADDEANIELMWLIDEATAHGKTLLWAGGDREGGEDAIWFDMTDALVDPAKFQFGIGKDTIPSIDEPKFAPYGSEELAGTRIGDQTDVIGYVANGIAKAYPVFILDRTEVVNDHFADDPFAVYW